MTLQAFYTSLFAPLKLRSRSENTKRLYQTTIRNLTLFLTRPAELADFTDDTVLAIHAIHTAGSRLDDPVFPWPFGHTYLWDAYGRLLRRAGLPHDSRSKFHRIRRSVASYYEAAGGNATELLGHSCRRVTKRYLDPRIVEHRFAVDLLFRPLH